jgi:hypothetical protein
MIILGLTFQVTAFIWIKRSKSDPSIFYSKATIVGAYVDDLLFMSSNEGSLRYLLQHLKQEGYQVNDLGLMKHFLGMRVQQEDEGITLLQDAYISDLIKEFGLLTGNSSKPTTVELDSIECQSAKSTDPTEYRSLVGSLLYLSTNSRPDLAHVVSQLGRHQLKATVMHRRAAMEVLRYANETKHQGLHFASGQLKDRVEHGTIETFTDAGWATCKLTRRSFQGYVLFYNSCVIDWNSNTQKTVALSSCESELMSLTAGSKSALFIQKLIQEIENRHAAIVMYCDNQSAINLSLNPEGHSRTKHISLREFFIRDLIQEEGVLVKYVPTDMNPADLMTKIDNKFKERCKLLNFMQVQIDTTSPENSLFVSQAKRKGSEVLSKGSVGMNAKKFKSKHVTPSGQ